MAAKKGLGKGLDALISDRMDREVHEAVQKKDDKVSRETLLPIAKIEPNRNQPRRHFDEDALNELADSIRIHGIVQPLIVHEKGDFYEIIAGERRYRAARIAGLKEVPVLVKNYEAQELYEIALTLHIEFIIIQTTSIWSNSKIITHISCTKSFFSSHQCFI